MPGDRKEFRKWDAHDEQRTGGTTSAKTVDDARTGLRLPQGKAWLLRLAWMVSTGMLVLGGLIMVLILSGEGHRIGL